eukprot:CAMPEP_0201518712 /NCGR_PEP_ID=MMETSP0161_2-20130828/9475_1 /ASSEMBLY_ACC=CAM_ASM_000251 /TAXON_ID=180227 /ORGANISM="Neoparamoeba aestuarina, Strain SoJaBio B1-5/56/2" /LENGTH=299 /DNA_ID=CAMNT_0047916555 /DNA_START=275 /DNA_END=1170 /DNA_ORIENTATION=-
MLESIDEEVLFEDETKRPVDESKLSDIKKAERRALLAFQNYRTGTTGSETKLQKFPEFRGEDKEQKSGAAGLGGEVDYSIESEEQSDVEGDMVRKAMDKFESPSDGKLYNEHFKRFDRGYPRFDGFWERKKEAIRGEEIGLVLDDISKYVSDVMLKAHSTEVSSLLGKQFVQNEVNAYAKKLREGKEAKLPKEAEEYLEEIFGKDWREKREEWGEGITITNWEEYELLKRQQHGQYSQNQIKEKDFKRDVALVEELNEMFKDAPFRLEDGEGIESLLYFHPKFDSMGDGGRQFYSHDPP